MNIVFQLLLFVCLVAGLHTTVIETSPSDSVSDDLDEGYFGLDDSERGPLDDTENDVDVDDEPTTPASRRPNGPRHRQKHPNGRQRGWHRQARGNWTAEQKIGHICTAIQSTTPNARSRHLAAKMNRLSPEVREQITSTLAARKQEMTACCQLDAAERLGCVENIRTQRYERVCNNEEPLCIWSTIKKQSNERSTKLSTIKDRCCALQDQERTTCFTEVRKNYRHPRRSRNRRI
jgi:hypothetical protein